MKLRIADLRIYVGYEVVAAMTAVLLLDRENRVICCFAAALLHELGHVWMMRLFSVRVRGLKLRLFDILIEADEPASLRADICITLGGVMMNFLCAVVFCPFSLKLGLPHLMLGVFNLLPVMSLDGGRLLSLLLSRRFSPRVSETVLRITTFLFLLPLMTAGIFLLFQSGYNYSLLAISLYLTAILLIKH